jgi:tRNA-2-methylthio-N6-dimethylallyladenosine synthase
MNASDAVTLQNSLQQMGLLPTRDPFAAELVVLITCVVRQSAEDKVVGRLTSLKNLRRRNPGASLLVMGCFVHDEPQLQARYPFVDAFFKPSDIAGALLWVREHLPSSQGSGPRTSRQDSPTGSPVCALVPISYGCDHHCTYCIVRVRRGCQRSLNVSEIMANVRAWVSCGAREVTLLGQNVDAYGQDLGSDAPDLADVLTAVHGVDGLWRIRFLTSHPSHIGEKLIRTVAQLPKVCPHFELPVQSGHDQVLKRMGRPYTNDQYRALIQTIRERVPGCSIATDVIVGFPGETEEHFQATYDLLANVRFDTVHIAKYSPRQGTPAARLPDDVTAEEKEHRRALLEKLQSAIAAEINAALLGQAVEVLVEERQGTRWKGRTRQNKLTYFESDSDQRGSLVSVEITWTGPWSLRGRQVARAISRLEPTE